MGAFLNVGQKDRLRLRITSAYLDLMDERDPWEINITEVCARANITRETFYRIFKNKEDILRWWIDQWMEQYGRSAKLSEGETRHISRDNLARTFSTIKNHENFLMACESASIGQYVRDAFATFLRSNYTDGILTGPGRRRRALILSAYAGSVYTAAVEWLRDGAKESPEEIADIVFAVYGEHI